MVVEALFAVETALLVASAAIVVYPLVTHRENVIHSTAALVLAASLLLLTGGTVATFYLSLPAIGNAGLVASTVAFAASQWLFCREFVRTDVEEPFTFEERPGGFEDARRE